MMVISQNEVRILYIGKQWAVGEYNGNNAWLYNPDNGALNNKSTTVIRCARSSNLMCMTTQPWSFTNYRLKSGMRSTASVVAGRQ